jgi:hypothetical protein
MTAWRESHNEGEDSRQGIGDEESARVLAIVVDIVQSPYGASCVVSDARLRLVARQPAHILRERQATHVKR